MAMIVDAFVGRCLDVLLELATEEVVRVLGVEDDLRRLQKKLKKIKDVLADAERRRIQDASVNSWLSELRDVMYDADDIIDLCRIEGRQLLEQGEASLLPSTSKAVRPRRFPFFSSCCNTLASVLFRHEIGMEIDKLNKRLEEIYKGKGEFSLPQASGKEIATPVDPRETSSLLTRHFVGAEVEQAANELVESLLNSQGGGLRVFGIVGLGGIGKTTLAQKIYNHQKVKDHFEKRLWVCVSQSYSEIGLLKQIIRAAGGGQETHAESKEELHHLVIDALKGKRFLLVLDDVWSADVWERWLRDPLEAEVASGSRVLVTTRKVDVARSMGAIQTYEVQKLSADDGWQLLRKTVFEDGADHDVQDLHEIGMKIVKKCDGLPLAIKVVGGVLKTKEDRRNNSEWEKLHRIQAWSVTGELPEEVRGALYLSYEDLPSQHKQCFLYCSLWPEDAVLSQKELCRLWVAEGFITASENSLPEDIADECFHDLIRRSLLHPSGTPHSQGMGCTIHDLTRSLALFLTRDESHIVVGNDSTNPNALKLPYPQKNSSRLRRLAIYDETETVLNAVKDSEGLRTLRMVRCEQIELQVIFQRFTHLRVLDLRDSTLEGMPSRRHCREQIYRGLTDTNVYQLPESLGNLQHLRLLDLSCTMVSQLPESLGNLQHLRLLDLDGTMVSQLPESLGCLVNLQFLNLSECRRLHALPKSITQLCNLRCLNFDNTPISHLPIGIRKLEHLTDLQGFVVGESQHGCGLDEMQSMSRLRKIHIKLLKRVSIRTGIQPLYDKTHLKELILESHNPTSNSGEDKQILEDLSPSPSLEALQVRNFTVLNFPLWISKLPNLTTLTLESCTSCQYLPPLGRLQQLRILCISSMDGVVTIGPEFLGCYTEDGQGHKTTPTAFPNLENLTISWLENWEEWVCDAKEVDEGTKKPIMPLPRLQYLNISFCPKLRALPDGLQYAAALKHCEIMLADSLREIKNIPSLENLYVEHCICLERISNLPALREMRVYDCPMLKHVEELDKLQSLTLSLGAEQDLPEWLLRGVDEVRKNNTLQALTLRCHKALREKCIEGGEYWPLLCHIPEYSVIGNS